jgi:hypothetical protein
MRFVFVALLALCLFADAMAKPHSGSKGKGKGCENGKGRKNGLDCGGSKSKSGSKSGSGSGSASSESSESSEEVGPTTPPPTTTTLAPYLCGFCGSDGAIDYAGVQEAVAFSLSPEAINNQFLYYEFLFWGENNDVLNLNIMKNAQVAGYEAFFPEAGPVPLSSADAIAWAQANAGSLPGEGASLLNEFLAAGPAGESLVTNAVNAVLSFYVSKNGIVQGYVDAAILDLQALDDANQQLVGRFVDFVKGVADAVGAEILSTLSPTWVSAGCNVGDGVLANTAFIATEPCSVDGGVDYSTSTVPPLVIGGGGISLG